MCVVIGKFGIKFTPHYVRGALRQEFPKGHERGVAFCHNRNSRRMKIVLPEERGIKVRYIKGGLMYATEVYRPAPRKVTAPTYQVPRFGQAPTSAPRPASSRVGLPLGNLTAVEAANRRAALAAARA